MDHLQPFEGQSGRPVTTIRQSDYGPKTLEIPDDLMARLEAALVERVVGRLDSLLERRLAEYQKQTDAKLESLKQMLVASSEKRKKTDSEKSQSTDRAHSVIMETPINTKRMHDLKSTFRVR